MADAIKGRHPWPERRAVKRQRSISDIDGWHVGAPHWVAFEPGGWRCWWCRERFPEHPDDREPCPGPDRLMDQTKGLRDG